MTDHLADTNVGNIEYIRKQDAVEALDGKIIVTGYKNADAVLQYMKDISNKIKSLPSVDVAPVVHGKWILGGYDDMFWICDKCEHRQSDYSLKPKAKYCPNCGAKMDREE